LPSAATSTITANGPVPADGTTRASIEVTVRDKFGNAIPNQPVELIVSGSLNDIRQPGATDNQGRASGSLASTRAELKIITAQVNGAYNLTPGTTVRFNALEARQIATYGGNGQTGNVNTRLAEALCVRVEDQFANGVPGVTVDFSVDAGGGRIIGATSVVSDSVGLACVNYVIGPTETENRVRAVSTGLRNSPIIFVATATDRSARRILAVSGNNQTGVVLENLPKLIA
jgi:hypothetical protein